VNDVTFTTDQELARLRMLVRKLEDEAKRRRCIDYDIVLGEPAGIRLCGPHMMSGPDGTDLELATAALRVVDGVARRVGLRVDTVVFRKAQE
jgi:hypothetical protein